MTSEHKWQILSVFREMNIVRCNGKPVGEISWKDFLPDERNAQEETAHPALVVLVREQNARSCRSNIVTMWEAARDRKPTSSRMSWGKMESKDLW